MRDDTGTFNIVSFVALWFIGVSFVLPAIGVAFKSIVTTIFPNQYYWIIFSVIFVIVLFNVLTGKGAMENRGKSSEKLMFPEPLNLTQVKEIFTTPDIAKSGIIFIIGAVYFGLIGISILGIIFH